MNLSMQYLTRLFAIPVAVFFVFLTGCESISDNIETSARYDSEEVFKGVIFGQGALAKLFPEMWDEESIQTALDQLEPDQVAQYYERKEQANEFSNSFITYIKAKEPHFLDNFRADIQSGDHLKVNAAVDRGYETVLAYAASLEGKDVETYKKELKALYAGAMGDAQAGKGNCVVVAIAVVAVVAVAVAAAVWLAVWRYKYFWDSEDSDKHFSTSSSRLKKDFSIDLVTQRLALQ